MSSDRRRLNLCFQRWPEEADLDRLGLASLSRGLIPDSNVWVAGHLGRSEASGGLMKPIPFHTHETSKICNEPGAGKQASWD